MSYPDNYRYSKSHEWVDVAGDTATIGITDYAQSSLGDIVFVELPSVGKSFAVGETFGSVESVKAVSDLYAPVAGEITEINTALNDEPAVVNTAANTTWFIKLKVADASALDSLLSAADYEKYVAEETGH